MAEQGKLFILWSSGDREVAIETVLVYALNSKLHGWFDEVELCIWGPSARLAVNDEEINVRLSHMISSGVKVTACKACTDHLALTEGLERIGVEAIYMGKPLTEKLKRGDKVLTF